MAKKIELLHTTYDESGNIESQEVVHPLTSPDCIIMENGKTLDEVMGDGIATPTLTHEGTSFKVGVGDSNIEVVDGDVAGMTLKGQSYQNILPKPTTLIMETDEKEFKINDKIDSNIIIDDNIAEIATVKGKTIVNTVQEESGSEYIVLGEDLSGQSIVTTNKPEGNIKGVTLQGQTLVNTIQEPCKDSYVVLGADDGVEISAETGGHGTIEDTIGGSIKSAILKGNTKYRDIDTGDILDTFDETKNLELVSVKLPVLTTSNEDGTKTNVLTVNEEVELRGIGDMKDELNLLTGEMTQRIGEVVLDGSEGWMLSTTKDNTQVFSLSVNNSKIKNVMRNSLIMCDKLKVASGVDDEIINFTSTLYIALLKSKASTVGELKVYLSQNPITFTHQLIRNSVKTIDLTVTDQDGNTIPHIQTQPNVTHITASSDYLIPTVTIDNNLAYDTIIKPSTLYTVRFKHNTVNADNPLTVDLGGTTQTVTSTEFTITTPSTLTHNQLVFSGKNNVVSEVQVIEGDVVGTQYPFFEGMNDVKFSDSKFIGRGKNLLHVGKGYSATDINGLKVVRNEVEQTITINGTCTLDNTSCALAPFYREFKKGERCAFSCKLISGTADKILFRVNDEQWKGNISCGLKATSSNIYETCIKTFYSDETYNRSSIRVDSGATFNNAVFKVMLEKIPTSGDYTPQYEPYKGVEVQQDVDSIPLTSDMFEQGAISSGKIFGMSYQQFTHTNTITNRIKSKTLIPIKPNSRLTITNFNTTTMKFWGWEFDKNGAYIKQMGDYNGTEYIISSNTYYIAVIVCYTDDSAITPSDLDSMNLILQEVPQEIVLRGIGDVKDELDLTRGEYIQRIGEVVLDGSDDEGWELMFAASAYGNPIYGTKSNYINSSDYVELVFKNDRIALQGAAQIINTNVEEAIYINTWENTGIIGIKIGLDFNDFKQYLSQNPVKVQYVLATPIIHKVNLTNTKVIPSYATETHYETITPSDSLIPNITIPSTLNYDVAIKPSTEYTIRANTSDNLTVDLGGATGTLSDGKVTLTAPATLTHNEVKFSGTGKVKELMVVEGNEIKDNVPFFNGMKDVQMGGIKLVNIARGAVITGTDVVSTNANQTQFTYNGISSSFKTIKFDNSLLKPNTTYTMYLNITKNTSTLTNPIKFLYSGNNYFIDLGGTGIKKVVVTTPKEIERIEVAFRPCTTSQEVVIQNPMIIEGDWTHLDEIPYIESEMIVEQPIIRSQGKNLLDLESKPFTVASTGTRFTKSGNTYTVTTLANSETYDYIRMTWTVDNDKWLRDIIGKQLTLSVSSFTCTNENSQARIQLRIERYDGTKHYIAIALGEKGRTFTMPTNTKYLQLQIMTNNTGTKLTEDAVLTISNIRLELGNTPTSYEPYKHQTLYSNRVIGYEERCYYSSSTGNKRENDSYTSVLADVDGLEVAYVTGGGSNYTFFDKDGVFISGRSYPNTAVADNQNGFIIVPSDAKYMRFACGDADNNYTPYTKATVTGELPLRSLPNGVCDTLNLVTGEYVQRVGEIVLDGSEIWGLNNTNSKTTCYHLTKGHNLQLLSNMKFNTNSMLCNRYARIMQGAANLSNNEGIFALSSYDAIYIVSNIMSTSGSNDFKQYLSQNPITVQYELATPIVRKLEFTTKGNYREQVLDGREEWIWNQDGTLKTTERFSLATITDRICGVDNLWCNTIETTNTYNFDAEGLIGSSASSTIYLRIKKDKCDGSWDGFVQWLSQNPIKISYLTNQQSSESYSNIHKPIFFNNVDVQFLPQNLDIQPKLTLQARTKNSYVMDMMKANTKYSIKLLSFSGGMLIDGTHYALANNRTFVSPSTLTNKELIITSQWYEPMIIEGDVTGKNLPYFKGILSSYHDVNEIELYSATNNIFDGKMELGIITDAGIRDNTNAIRTVNFIPIKPSTLYFIGCGKSSYKLATYYYDKNYKFIGTSGTNANNAITTPSGCEYMKFRTSADLVQNDLTTKFWVNEAKLESYIPHAHNTTLIEMPTRLETVKVVRPVMENGSINSGNGANYDIDDALVKNVRTKDYLPVQPGEIIKFYNNGRGRAVNMNYYDINKQFVKYEFYDGVSTRPTVPKDCYFVRMYCGKSACSDITLTRQAWKPIQLNSLPNGVCDEIIMKPNSNKTQLVQRVGKVVLDGSENWSLQTDFAQQYSTVGYSVMVENGFNMNGKDNNIISETYTPYNQNYLHTNDGEGITIGYGRCYIRSNVCETSANTITFKNYLQENPITVYYELATPIIHEIQLKGYPYVYENGTVTFNTDTPHKTLVSYNVNQEQLINTQNETIIRHNQQIDDLYYYIEMYLEEIYQTELFRMKLELSL